jgi:hypothetical protein
MRAVHTVSLLQHSKRLRKISEGEVRNQAANLHGGGEIRGISDLCVRPI